MSRQTRRAAATAAKVIDSDNESGSDTEKNKTKRPQRRDKRVDSQRFRMTTDDDENFVQICVDYFDKINSSKTLKGTFTTKKSDDNNKIWEDITNKCNVGLEVSTIYMYFHE